MNKTNWARSNLIKKLLENIVTVEFTKVNGDYRKMKCTLQNDFLPEALAKEPDDLVWDDKKEKTKESLSVWDTEANGWRSFRWDNLKEYSVESA